MTKSDLLDKIEAVPEAPAARAAVGVPFALVALWAGFRSVELAADGTVGVVHLTGGLTRAGWSLAWAVAAAVIEAVVFGWVAVVIDEVGLREGAGVVSTLALVGVLLAQSWGRTPIVRRHRRHRGEVAG